MIKVLEINELQNIIRTSFTNKEMVNKLNNLLIDKQLQVFDGVLDMMDRRCSSYQAIAVRMTELRGEAIAMRDQINDEFEAPAV